MMPAKRTWPTIPAIGLGFALSFPAVAAAQGPPVSSGSGSGTGTGQSASSFGATGTGTESSTGLGSTGTGREGLPGGIGGRPRPGQAGDLTRPIDRDNKNASPEGASSPGGLNVVDPHLFLDARAVLDPGERSLALVRIAQTAIFSKQLEDAHTALVEAAPAALAATQPLIRQQRTLAVVDTLLSLAEERMGPTGDIVPASDLPATPPTDPAPGDANRGSNNPGSRLDQPAPIAALPDTSRRDRLSLALPEWSLAVDMARRVEDTTARTEALFRVVESEAYSSQRLITDPIRSSAFSGRPDPTSLAPEIRSFSDDLLVKASQHSALIERPIWRNYATYSIISNAAASSQFSRGFEIARDVTQPETRTNVLIRLAEGQATNGRQAEATAAYAEAARAVALIPQVDPRETLVGVLVDSLVSFGRFEDARACVKLYFKTSNQVLAYAAVAESQGRRGLAESARQWISTEIAPEYRPLMYRKVNDGILASIEQNRSRDMSRSN